MENCFIQIAILMKTIIKALLFYLGKQSFHCKQRCEQHLLFILNTMKVSDLRVMGEDLESPIIVNGRFVRTYQNIEHNRKSLTRKL
jgi:hypothetical protein